MKRKLDWERIVRSKVFWAVVAESLILLVAVILRPDFLKIEINEVTGMLYGVPIDILNRSAEIMIIAMGMMVDNAIVVTDGIMIRVGQGMDRKQAAIEAASGPAWPLLGATVVACMAFYPISASTYDTGEYAGSLFTVVAISLILSWVFCQTIAPLMCIAILPSPKPGEEQVSPYQSKFYQRFRGLLSLAIRRRR